MMKFIGLANVKKNQKFTKFLIINFALVIFFAITYHLSDIFLYKFPTLGKNMGLGTINQIDTIYSYIYFSLITQSGVGFGGILPDGGNVITTNSNIIKFLSLAQLSSVIYMLAWAL